MKNILYTRKTLSSLPPERCEHLLQRMLPKKRLRLSRLPADRQALSILGDLLARQLAAALLDTDENAIHLSEDENGRPFVPGREVYVSIAHSGDWVCAAAARQPLGLDAEVVRRVSPRLVEKVCSPAEQAWISAGQDPSKRFLKLWTMKEAYGKFTGKGVFRVPRRELCFSGGEILEVYADCRFVTPEEAEEAVISLCTLPLSND